MIIINSTGVIELWLLPHPLLFTVPWASILNQATLSLKLEVKQAGTRLSYRGN